MGQASPNKVIHHKNKVTVFMDTQNAYIGGSPMNLSFTYAKYFYSNFYCGGSAASATGSTGEDEGCSVSDGTTFGSVRGRAMFASDPGSTPSTGWAMSS